MEDFLSNDNVVMDAPIRDTISLVSSHQTIHVILHSIHNDFVEEFIYRVTPCNRSKLMHSLGTLHFRDQAKGSLVDIFNFFFLIK